MPDEEDRESARVAVLKVTARERAAALGHHLEPFRASRDGLHVAFCEVCRNVVIIDTRQPDGLRGYALQASCARAAQPTPC